MRITQLLPSDFGVMRHSTIYAMGIACLGTMVGCQRLAIGDTLVTQHYEATAEVRYVWQVEYAESFDIARTIRQERFASTALTNRNGVKPEGAVTGPDERGLWWPELPPRPTVDELEARQGSRERRTDPQLIKQVDYALTYQVDGQESVTLPSHDLVYRQAVKAHAQGQGLAVTLSADGSAVARAEAVE